MENKKIIGIVIVVLALLIGIGSCTAMNKKDNPNKNNDKETEIIDDKNSTGEETNNETEKDTPVDEDKEVENKNDTSKNKDETDKTDTPSKEETKPAQPNKDDKPSKPQTPNKGDEEKPATPEAPQEPQKPATPEKPEEPQPKPDPKPDPKPEEPSKPAHEHKWVAQYETQKIEHKEEGHYEKVKFKDAWDEDIYEERHVQYCNACGALFKIMNPDGSIKLVMTNEEKNTHMTNHTLKGETGGFTSSNKVIKVGTKHHDAVYENKWVVDKKAWTEEKKVLVGYKCECGKTK